MSTTATTIDPERQMLGEVEMVGRDRWEEIHRRAGAGASIRAIARELDLDRKTVRQCLRQTEWKPYQRATRSETLLTAHAEYLRRRASAVDYSAQVLFQELRGRQYEGSYETVKRFVRPLREMQLYAAVTRTRFETPPGLQSQIDWGQARVWLGAQRQVRHIFVLTLGYSRRSFYVPCLSEALGELLDAHEQAFTHFGGHTQEHLYDRPRTVCAPRVGPTACGGTRRSRRSPTSGASSRGCADPTGRRPSFRLHTTRLLVHAMQALGDAAGRAIVFRDGRRAAVPWAA